MSALTLKIPPAALVLIAAILMWSSARYVPQFGLEIPARVVIALTLVALGAITSAAGVISLRKMKTTVNPFTPNETSAFVHSGIYGRTRNPIYLGFLLLLLGLGIYLSNAVGMLFIPLFVFYMNRFQIEPEEQALRSMSLT